jgi:16S rRNA (cytidine1402-2'-O)-methyltransferase
MSADPRAELSPDASCLPEAGVLYVVATPIGHRADLSPRAASILAHVDLIAAEDTRMTQRLLEVDRIHGRLISLNEHNEADRVGFLLEALGQGRSVALVSDAGTPLISDPGFRILDAAHAEGIRVSVVPGPCAAVAALSASGLPTDRFWFEGFLPPRSAARRKRLAGLADLAATLIFYVPARDLEEVLRDLADTLGPQRQACLNRELTKRHETIHRAALDQLGSFIAGSADQRRGEAVLVVAGNDAPDRPVSTDALVTELAEALPPSRAAAILARLTGIRRQDAWTRIEAARAGGPSGAPAARRPS